MAKAKQEPVEEYISGEQYQQLRDSGTVEGKKVTVSVHSVTIVIVVVVALIVGFLGGMAYQKGRRSPDSSTVSANNSSGVGAPGGGGFRRHSGGFGQVTTVSPTSITISNQRTGASNTYAITPSTTITNNGQTAGVSDIQTGETVVIMTSSDTSTATNILINPGFGGGGSATP